MVKRVVTSIIILAVLMGVLVACGDSNSSLVEVDTEEAKDEAEKVLEDQKEQESRQEQPTQPSPPTTSEPSPPLVLHLPGEVQVVVVSEPETIRGAEVILDRLSISGYDATPVANDEIEDVAPITHIYFSQDYELDARNIALILDAPLETVLPIPLELAVDDLSDVNVLVLVGSDALLGVAEAEAIPEEFKLVNNELICGRSGSGPIFGSSGNCQKTKPIWSPDGQQIFFINKNDASPDFTDDEASSGIYVMSPDGSNLSRILGIAEAKYTGSSVWHRDLKLSPTGDRIAFVEICAGCYGTMWGHTYLFVADIDGTNRFAADITNSDSDSPVWSVDGKSLIFDVGNRYGTEIFVSDLTKETLKELPNLGDRHSALISSPDGTLIAGTVTDTVTGAYDGKRLFIMSIDGPPLSLILEQDEDTFIDRPQFWTTDGQHIIFDRFIYSESGEFKSGLLGEKEPEQLNPTQIYEFQYDVIRMIMDIDTLTARPLNENERLKYQDGISPDGTKVVFAKIVNGSSEIFIRDADGTNVKQLTFSAN